MAIVAGPENGHEGPHTFEIDREREREKEGTGHFSLALPVRPPLGRSIAISISHKGVPHRRRLTAAALEIMNGPVGSFYGDLYSFPCHGAWRRDVLLNELSLLTPTDAGPLLSPAKV